MIIFMAGLPYSGKSFVLSKLLDKYPSIDRNNVICPRDLRSPEYVNNSHSDKRLEDLRIWQLTLSVLCEFAQNNKNDIAIYDSACVSSRVMDQVFKFIRKSRHQIVYLYVSANDEIRMSRSQQKLTLEVDNEYKSELGISLKYFKNNSDKFIIVDNSSNESIDLPNIDIS